MNHDKRISITKVQTNFVGVDQKKSSNPTQSLNKSKSKAEANCNALVINISTRDNIDDPEHKIKPSIGELNQTIKPDQSKLQNSQLTSSIKEQNLYTNSSIKEIHNNVFNFFPITNFEQCKLNNRAASIVTQNNELEKGNNCAILINEKNELIKNLINENSKLKHNLQEKLNENKLLKLELEKGHAVTEENSFRNVVLEKRIKRAALLSPKSKNECKQS